MRKIDWTQALSDEDIAWVRQAGFMSEERIEAHQSQFDAGVPDDEVKNDTLTRSALDPQARMAERVEGTGTGSPVRVVPEDQNGSDEDNDDPTLTDDYDLWKVPELEIEVQNRNAMPDTTEVTVEGTGKDGKVLKGDLIKGLRLWDQENPDAIAAA